MSSSLSSFGSSFFSSTAAAAGAAAAAAPPAAGAEKATAPPPPPAPTFRMRSSMFLFSTNFAKRPAKNLQAIVSLHWYFTNLL